MLFSIDFRFSIFTPLNRYEFDFFVYVECAADQQQDRRQTCLSPGLYAESAGCEALRAEDAPPIKLN
jgi:hypothetical protein